MWGQWKGSGKTSALLSPGRRGLQLQQPRIPTAIHRRTVIKKLKTMLLSFLQSQYNSAKRSDSNLQKPPPEGSYEQIMEKFNASQIQCVRRTSQIIEDVNKSYHSWSSVVLGDVVLQVGLADTANVIRRAQNCTSQRRVLKCGCMQVIEYHFRNHPFNLPSTNPNA